MSSGHQPGLGDEGSTTAVAAEELQGGLVGELAYRGIITADDLVARETSSQGGHNQGNKE